MLATPPAWPRPLHGVGHPRRCGRGCCIFRVLKWRQSVKRCGVWIIDSFQSIRIVFNAHSYYQVLLLLLLLYDCVVLKHLVPLALYSALRGSKMVPLVKLGVYKPRIGRTGQCTNHAPAIQAPHRDWCFFLCMLESNFLARSANWLEGLYISVVGKMRNAESCRVSGRASYALPSYNINENIRPKNPSIF